MGEHVGVVACQGVDRARFDKSPGSRFREEVNASACAAWWSATGIKRVSLIYIRYATTCVIINCECTRTEARQRANAARANELVQRELHLFAA